MWNRRSGLAVLVGAVALGAVTWATLSRASFQGNINALQLDLKKPDAFIATSALSRLPRDLLKAPVLRDVLTEEFAFYYQEHEDRLALSGALKRIAYEHETTLTDKLIESALDEPAEIAMWADAKGAPRHWMMSMSRSVLARALQQLAGIAASDTQWSVIGDIAAGGSKVTVYALKLSPRRTLALAALSSRVVVLSDPGLLFNAAREPDDTSRQVIADLLSADAAAQSLHRRHFGLGDARPAGHTLVADAHLLSFGYEHFFPGLKALRFDLDAGGGALRTGVRVDAAKSLPVTAGEHTLWQALPVNPAACTLLPTDWTAAKSVLGEGAPLQDKQAAWNAFASQLEGPAAVCWYAKSQLHTPVFVAMTAKNAPGTDAALAGLSAWITPARPASAPMARAVDKKRSDGATLWQHEVAAPWGPYGVADSAGEPLAAYRPALAHRDRWVTYSQDDALVELALDAQARRYPSLADSLTLPSTLAVLVPRQVADLLQREAYRVLSPSDEPFRQAIDKQLVPRLDALRRLPAVQATAQGAPDAQGWVGVEWLPLTQPAAAKPTATLSPAPASGGRNSGRKP